MSSDLTHVDQHGDARMVEVSDKSITKRTATATGSILLNDAARDAVAARTAKKGDVLTVAQIAGIQGAKRTHELIPLCHPLPLTGVDVILALEGNRVVCTATAKTEWRTGVEMEAITAVSVALVTVYDMLKAVDRGMVIEGIRLLEKTGGRSGHWKSD